MFYIIWIIIFTNCVTQVYPSCDDCTTCDAQTSACLQCDPGFYRYRDACRACEHVCATNATSTLPKCRQDRYCEFGCIKGFYGDYCTSPCSVTCKENTCDRDSGRCTLGCSSPIYSGDLCLEPCPAGCSQGQCTQDKNCLYQCKPNFYNDPQCDRKCDVCSSNNDGPADRLCDVNNGTCLHGCDGGTSWGPYCNTTCSAGCDGNQCDFISGQCTGSCINDTSWGDTCFERCNENCLNNTCLKFDGTCLAGCATNTTWGLDCSRNCSDRCSANECDITTGDCTGACAEGMYWGSNCSNSCTGYCENTWCDKSDGSCVTGCQNNSYWGSHCETFCPANCLDDECRQSDGICTKGCTNATTWGEKCANTCPINCSNGKCTQFDGNCTHGCENDLMWGDHCTKQCHSNCELSKCEQGDGTCTRGCVNNASWGEICNNVCPVNCTDGECGQSNGSCTLGCNNDDLWGKECTKECPVSCKQGKCFQVNGRCTRGCNDDTSWGDNCTKACPQNCVDRMCVHTTGHCSKGCVNDTVWGVDCQNPCSTNCNGTECYPSNGYCISGCATELLWGIDCSYPCSENCLELKCNRSDGHCTGGCVNNTIWGSTCNETCFKCESGCDQSSGECSGFVKPPASINIWLIIGIVVGSVILIAVLVAIIVVTRRKRSRGQKKFVDDDEGIEVETRSDSQGNRPRRAINALSTLFVQNPVMKMMQKRITQKIQRRKTHIVKTNNIKVEQLLSTVLSMERSAMEAEFESLGDGYAKPYEAAVLSENTSKNTYIDIYPYDDNRVVLTREDAKGTDYINASFIDGFKTKKRHIAAQGPSRQTKDDFWKMVWEQKVNCIVMLSGVTDNECNTADNYLPELGMDDVFGDIAVYSRSRENYADFVINIFKLTKAGEEWKVIHMQFTGWQGGIPPSSPSSLIEFHQKYRSLVQEDQSPTVVHCSAGVGRTGVFTALDNLLDEGLSTGSVDVYNCVSRLREQRVQMVQTQEQYEFLYKAVAQLLGLHCQRIPLIDFASHSIDLEDQFQKCQESLEFDKDEIPAMTIDQEIRRKDRPTSDIPNPHYRPTLASNSYINAVQYDTYRQKEGIITTQMPTPETVADFCRLVKERNCCIILMLNCTEQNRKSHGIYWPKKGSVLKCSGVKVSTLTIEDNQAFVDRTLKFESKVKKTKESLEVKMIQYKGWTEVSALPDASQLVDLVKAVRQHMNKYPGRPLLVHCLNGSEQSGMYCAVHDLLEKLLTEDEISVINSIRKLKVRLPTALPTLGQFRLCYEVVNSYIANAEIMAEDKV